MGIETPPEAAGSVSPTSAETLDAPDFGAGRWDRRSKPEKNGARSHDTRPQQKLQSPTAVEMHPRKRPRRQPRTETRRQLRRQPRMLLRRQPRRMRFVMHHWHQLTRKITPKM